MKIKTLILTVAFLTLSGVAHAAPTDFFIQGLAGGGTKCLKILNSGLVQRAAADCGSGGGGGSGSGTWATTTSNVANQLINYPLNSTDIVTIGDSSTTSAKFFFDPNSSRFYLAGNGTTTGIFVGLTEIKSRYFTATSTTQASTFPYASTTMVSATTASTSALYVGLGTGVLKIVNGLVSLATAGTDYQAASNYITALTGDVTASGPGSAAATLATVNSNVGSFTNASITVNGKGLVTAASSGSAPALAATTITVAGTANQITSSAGAQDLSANRTWTLSLPSALVLPGGLTAVSSSTLQNFTALNSTSTNATTTSHYTDVMKIGSLSGILKGTSGLVGTAANGTDYSLISALSCSAGQHLNSAAANGTFTCSADTGSGGGAAAGTWSTTTSQVSGVLINYSNNNSDVVSIGSNSSTTAKFFFDPNGGTDAFLTSFRANRATTTQATSTNFAIVSAPSALLLTNSSGSVSAYTAQSCTNQFVRGLSALGVPTCATVGAADVSLANLTATDSTLTFSGTYNGSTARTIGLNLGNANVWTVGQSFLASTTLQAFTATNATTTNATTTQLAVSSLTSGNCLQATVGGRIIDTGSACATGSGSAYPFNVAPNGTTTQVQLNGGFLANASSTVGGGTQITGLTIAGGATTTGNAYIAGTLGVGSTTPFANLAVNPTAGSASNQFVIGSSTATNFIVNNSGNVGVGVSSPLAKLDIFNNATANANAQETLRVGSNSSFATPGSGPMLSFIDGALNAIAGIKAVAESTVVNYGLTFRTSLGGTIADRFFMTAAGSFGVGTSSPYAKLSVDGRGVFNQDVRADYYTATSTTIASQLPYASTTMISATTASTTNLILSSAGGTGTKCLQVATNGTVSAAAAACGSGGGTSLITASSTDANYNYLNSGIYLQAPALQATSTTATSSFAGGVTVGPTPSVTICPGCYNQYLFGSTTSSTSLFGIHGLYNDNFANLFTIASSTNSATTTLFTVDKVGTTTMAGGSVAKVYCYSTTNCGQILVGSGATTTSQADGVSINIAAFATTSISAGDTIWIWAGGGQASSNNYLDVKIQGATATSTLDHNPISVTGSTVPMNLVGKYTATTTGTLFMAIDSNKGTTLSSPLNPRFNWNIFH